ncbi:hypothetical protein BDQ12DRAFT_728222 [Crucibulum laeve]|uniref:DUF7704 domain-containing protein n=1 Tax=Crucibulum laeve TaxID=68775 RepID=A0A5C3LJC6_9AGAR|nr:hypothetical protein BDQ12DRAFT_728222 [Crucibulum laeve]
MTLRRPISALPNFYYCWFAGYEPLLTLTGFIGALSDPTKAHNAQAPWKAGTSPLKTLPLATLVTTLQFAYICALLGVVNVFVLTAVRNRLREHPGLQETIIFSLFTPLLVGDFFHLSLTLWMLGDDKWNVNNWTPMVWTSVLVGMTLTLPRIAWLSGIGRFVERRDGSSMNEDAEAKEAVASKDSMEIKDGIVPKENTERKKGRRGKH